MGVLAICPLAAWRQGGREGACLSLLYVTELNRGHLHIGGGAVKGNNYSSYIQDCLLELQTINSHQI